MKVKTLVWACILSALLGALLVVGVTSVVSRTSEHSRFDHLGKVFVSSGGTELSYMQGNWTLHEFNKEKLSGEDLKSYVDLRAPMCCTKFSFTEPFSEGPSMFLGLSTIDAAHPLRLGLVNNNINLGGTEICVQTAGESKVYTASFDWVAFQTDPLQP